MTTPDNRVEMSEFSKQQRYKCRKKIVYKTPHDAACAMAKYLMAGCRAHTPYECEICGQIHLTTGGYKEKAA